jgi:putative ABC transport system permease protein
VNAAVAAQLARGALAASGLRIALTLFCIALGVALAGAVHTVHTSALAEIDRAARALAGTADMEIRGARSGFDDALFAIIAARPEVAVASPVIDVEAALPGAGGTLRVLGIDPFRAVRLQPAFVASAAATGSGSAGELLDDQALWLSPPAMARLGARVGDRVRLAAGSGEREYRVAGALPGLQEGGELAVVDIAAAQVHFGRVGLLSRIDLRLRPGVDEQRFREELRALLPPGVMAAGAASVSGRAEAISRAYRVNLDALALVALATGAFLVFSTLALRAARRRQEFALLRALGVTRAGLAALLALEGAAIGAVGAALGTALGLAGSRFMLGRSGADLGAGYFGGHGGVFAPDPWALAGIALLGIAMSVAGALWVARAVGRMEIADALRDRAVDLPHDSRRATWLALALFTAGVPLLFAAPIAGLPLAGYAAIALWLAASVASVAPLCRAILGRFVPKRNTIAALALAQVRHLPGHLAASVAGIVVSASLCIAMAIMVHSFRVSFEGWLRGVIGADLYVRAAREGDTGYFSLEEQRRIAALPGVRASEPVRFDRLVIGAGTTPLTLVARPIDAHILEGFRAQCLSFEDGTARPLDDCLGPRRSLPPNASVGGGDDASVWISEAARDLHGWKPGQRIELPIAGRATAVRVAGVIRDYGRTWGAVMMPIEDYRRLTGDDRAHDLGLHLAAGADSRATQEAIRAALPQATGLAMEDAAEIRRRSLEIFDRSFAVTYALEAIAIAIGLAGVTSSFAALAWSRRREFGVLRFLGLTRREILSMLAWEGAATGALGAAIGFASGAAISLVLVRVVNRQSFHWSIEVHWPLAALAILLLGIVAACAIGARASAAFAVRREAVLAVKDDA